MQNVHANQINTAETGGAYQDTFCPPVRDVLNNAKFKYECAKSSGTRENIQRVQGAPTELGFAQYDVFALERSLRGGESPFTVIRSDIVRECLFMVTKNDKITNYGEVSALAAGLRFILPPQKSGSTGTFEFLQQIDPDGLGQASDIVHVSSVEDAIQGAMSANDTVALFVQFPDPANTRFKRIKELKGRVIPVIDRNILRQKINGEKIYFAQEADIGDGSWFKSGSNPVTACTPMVLFTGKNAGVTAGDARTNHADLISTLKAAKADDLQPKHSMFKKVMAKAKALSAKSVEKTLEATEKARTAAKPMLDKARDMGEKAMDKARPALDKAKEATSKAMEKAKPMMDAAKEKAAEAMEKAKPMMDAAKEKAAEAMEKAKPMLDAAKEKAAEAMEKAKPMMDAAKEKAAEAMEKAKPMIDAAKEKATEAAGAAKEKATEMMDRAKDAPAP